MSLRIEQLRVQNFKVFRDIHFDFKDTTVIILDGPNGFGKTSFFDAVELLLTGRIRRYEELAEEQVNKQVKELFGCPFLYEGESDSGDLIIKGEIRVNNQALYLMRRASRLTLLEQTKIKTDSFPLFELSDFDDNETAKRIEDENFIIGLQFGTNFLKNFAFLNYIEQEENTYLLKSKDKERKSAINHLFNTTHFRESIDQLKTAISTIGKLCNPKSESKLQKAKEEIDELQKKFVLKTDPVPYHKLIPSQDHAWDFKELVFPIDQLSVWLGEKGILGKLSRFVSGKTDFINDRDNRNLEKTLWPKREAVEMLLRYGSFIKNKNESALKLEIHLKINELLSKTSSDVLQVIRDLELVVPEVLKVILSNRINIDDFNQCIDRIRKTDSQATTIASSLSGLRSSREGFLQAFKKHTKVSSETSLCPTCGHDWKEAKHLSDAISKQTELLESLSERMNDDISKQLEFLNSGFLIPITSFLQDYQQEHQIDISFLREFIELDDQKITFLAKMEKEYSNAGIDLFSYLNTTPSLQADLKTNSLKSEIDKLKKPVEVENLEPFFSDIFISIFDENTDALLMIDHNSIEAKRSYLQWRYIIQQNLELKEKKEEYNKLKSQFDSAKKMMRNLKKLQKDYEDACHEYERDLVNGIEILFHLYSGRIIQDCQGGLGLFINSDRDGIRFLENPRKTHDAVFSMSSGQLAALVISFTLALNKRYSRSKLLLIDDPIQTLDELNIVGFVDLLRTEFSDRQIFISTHEDQMSAYMRYKFQKYEMTTTRLNFKAIQFRSER